MITRRSLLTYGAALGATSIATPCFALVGPRLVLTAPTVVPKGRVFKIDYELVLEKWQSCSMLVLAADRQQDAGLGVFRFFPGTRVIRGSVQARIFEDQNISGAAILSDHQIPTARIAVRILSTGAGPLGSPRA